MGTRFVKSSGRRQFFWQCLTFVLVALGRRVWAQAAEVVRFRPLARPVLVRLDDLATPGKAFPFTADGVTLSSAAMPNQPLRISGMVVRTSAGDNAPERFRAVCLKCPHEGCDVDFIADPGTLPEEITSALGKVTQPVYVCPCHNSTFRMEDGSRLFGPSPRGLYQFHVTAVQGAAVEIGEVEEDVLLFA